MSGGLLSPDDRRAGQFLRLQGALLVLDVSLRQARDRSRPPGERADILRALDGAVDDVRHQFLQARADRDVLERVPGWLLPRPLRTGAESAEVVGLGGLGLLSHILGASEGNDRSLAEVLANQPTAWTALALQDEWAHALAVAVQTAAAATTPSWQQAAAWLPLIHQATGGAYLGVVHIGPRPEWANPVQAEFGSALRAGRALALEWGGRIGVDDDTLAEITGGQLWVEGVPGSLTLAEGSGQAAATVAALQRMLRPGRAEQVLTSQAEPTPDTDAKRMAALEHRALLERVPLDASADAIAEGAWPTTWRDAVRSIATAALDAAGHTARILTDLTADIDPPVVDDIAVLVEMEQSGRLAAALEHGHRSIVVGGPAASGRTVCSRLGAVKWQERTLGRVVELRLADGRLPGLDELQITIHRAQLSLRLSVQEQCLWILEDLTPYDDACDLDAVLAPAASEATGSIVAVCMYAGGQHWSADLLVTVPSLAGPDSTGRFLEQLNSARVGRPLMDWELSKVRQAAGADLWMAGRLFSRLANTSDDSRDSEAELLDGARRRALAGVPTEQVPVLKVIAACSLLSVGFPRKLLDGLAPSTLREVGGRKDQFGRWRLRSPSLCAALLTSSGTPENHTRYHQYPVEALVGELLPYFSERLDDDTALRLLLALLDRARILAPAVHRRLLRALGGRIIAAVDAASALPLLARVLLVLDAGAEKQDRTELLGHLLDGLVARGWTRLRPVEAYACVRALRAYRDDASGRRAGDLRSVLRTASTELDVVVARAGPSQSLPVIRELHAFHEEVTARSIPALVHAALSSADPHAWRDYQSAAELLLLAVRTTPGQQLATLSECADAAGLRALLRSPGANVDPATTLGRFALQRLLSGTAALEESPAPRLGEAALVLDSVAARSSVTRTRMGLTLLERVDRPFAHQLARRANLGVSLALPLTLASGGEAAGLLQTLSKLHLPAAAQLLYDHDGHVRVETLNQLASACSSTMDLKGAGHLLNTIGMLDLALAVPLDTAGTALARQLRPFLEQAIGDDVRASVVKHAVRGLITARCDSAQLDALRQTCLNVIAREIRDNDKEHGPQLGLLLADCDALGPEFLSELAVHVDEDIVVERMHGAQTPQALAAFHVLGRTLTLATSRDLVYTFTTQWLEPTLDRIVGYPPLSQLEAAAAIAKTLAAAGVADSGRVVLQHSGTAAWSQRLSRVSNPGVLASCLEYLQNISPPLARQVVVELAGLLAGPARGRRAELRVAPRPGAPSPLWLVSAQHGPAQSPPQVPTDGFVRMLGRAFLEPEPVLNVLGALEQIETDLGSAVGEALTQLPSWHSRRRALLDEIDNPVQLGRALQRMRVLGLEVGAEAVSTMVASWVAQAGSLRSPLAAESLLRGFAATGDVAAATEFADRLVPQRLGERLARCLTDDLHVVASLLDSLRAWAPPGRAAEVAAQIPVNALSALDASAAARLLAALMRCSPAVAHTHLPAALEVLHCAIAQRYAVDHAGEWVGIGWLARSVAACGATVAVSETVLEDVAALPVQPAVRLWALAHLGGDCAGAVHEAVEVVRTAEPRRWVYAATLLGSLRAGVPAAELELELFTEALEAEPEWVLALLDAAATDPALTAWLAPDGPWLVDNAEWAAENGQPRGRDIARLAVALFGDVSLTGA